MDFFEALWRDLGSVFGKRVQLGTNSVTTLNIIVWSLFIGFMIGIGVTLYNKMVLGSLVRELIEHGAHTEDAALTAASSMRICCSSSDLVKTEWIKLP